MVKKKIISIYLILAVLLITWELAVYIFLPSIFDTEYTCPAFINVLIDPCYLLASFSISCENVLISLC